MTKKRILTLVTGGFDPLHSGHIAYFEQAKDLTNYLVVGLNTEEWLTNKKGQYFMSWKERAEIIRHLDVVDAVITVEDDEYGSACSAIERCLEINNFPVGSKAIESVKVPPLSIQKLHFDINFPLIKF